MDRNVVYRNVMDRNVVHYNDTILDYTELYGWCRDKQ
jgi:hypothetical protein